MALALAGLALAAPSTSGAQGSDQPPPLTLRIEAPPELSRFANRLENWQPRRLEPFAALLGLATPAGEPSMAVKVILAPESGELAREAPSWVAGYARGDASVVVLFPARVPAYPDRSLEELLGHEVAHLMIHRAAAGRPLPRWFHEGLSMLAEQAWGLEDQGRVALAVLVRGRSDLAALDRLFVNPGQVHRAYALAGALVRDLVNRHGPGFPAALLARVAAGADFDSAFESAAGESLDRAANSFWRRFTFWYRWFPFLTSSTALWLAVTVLALVAVRRRRRRTRLIEEKWRLEEAWEVESSRLEPAAPSDDELVN